ncbi:MAG: hypothetical protein JWR19_71 [Pedosphaera sp.]|nr:hypothetical protein [Pedosphaera sp.]
MTEPFSLIAMHKIISLTFLAGGIILLYFGYHEAQSFHSGAIRFITGSPSSKATWMIIAGVIATLAGIIGVTRGAK